MHKENFIEWVNCIKLKYPNAIFTVETGKGETYGEAGNWTAYVGPDAQADVVGVFTEEFFEIY